MTLYIGNRGINENIQTSRKNRAFSFSGKNLMLENSLNAGTPASGNILPEFLWKFISLTAHSKEILHRN